MIFTLYKEERGAAPGRTYPEAVRVKNARSFADALRYDHVGVEFKDGIRRSECFISSSVIVLKCDNSFSDESTEWMTVEEFEKKFSSINYALVLCRNKTRESDGASTRPRFVVYFPITECIDSLKYTALKRAVQKAYPFFDDMTLDAGRSFGSFRNASVIWNEGDTNIDKIVKGEVSECDSLLERIGGGDLLVSVDDDNAPTLVDTTPVQMRSTMIEGDSVYLSSTGVAKGEDNEDVVLVKLSGFAASGFFSMHLERHYGADYAVMSFKGDNAYNEALTLLKSAYLSLLSQKKKRGVR